MRRLIFSLSFLMSILLVACSNSDDSNQNSSAEAEKTDVKQLVASYSANTETEDSASITSEQLVIKKADGKEEVVDLPEDEFFISIAPYVNETHPCATHSLTGCQGELTSKEFDVYVEDEDGKVVIDKTMTSRANGFIDLWLPRDQKYNVKINYEGKAAEAEISTSEGDNTCIATMQLM